MVGVRPARPKKFLLLVALSVLLSRDLWFVVGIYAGAVGAYPSSKDLFWYLSLLGEVERRRGDGSAGKASIWLSLLLLCFPTWKFIVTTAVAASSALTPSVIPSPSAPHECL